MVTYLVCLWLYTALPPEAGEVLGFDPASPPSFQPLYQRTKPPANEPAWTVESVSIANVGGNRFIFRVTFSAAYAADNGLLILYVDSDADPATGRTEHGCEFMLILHNRMPSVTAYASDGTRTTAPRPRTWVGDRSVWISYDLDFPQQENRSTFRLCVLSEKSTPHVAVDSVRYATYQGPPVSSEPKHLVPQDYRKSRGFDRIFGLRRIEAVQGGPGSVTVSVTSAELRGFRRDRSEYRCENAYCRGPGHELAFTSPVTGTYFLGAIIYDDHGKDLLGVRTEESTLGFIVGTWDDRKQHLFVTSQPVSLTKGQPITLSALGEGRHRTEALVFVPKRPVIPEPVWQFRKIAPFEDRICFITTWPATCELLTDTGLTLTEAVRSENHRFHLPGVREGTRLRYRLKSRTPEGTPIITPWMAYSWSPRRNKKQERSGRVTLTVNTPMGQAPAPWPVSSGVPFPRGELASKNHVTLHRNGKEIPLQTAVLARWTDASVKWLLCDFRHEGGAGKYELRYGPGRSRTAAASVVEPPKLYHLELVRGDGVVFRAPIKPRPEESGPLRACFRDTGHFRSETGEDFWRYDVRAHIFPGLPWTRVLVTVGAGEMCPEFSEIRSLSWRLEHPVPQKAMRVAQFRDDRCESPDPAVKRWEKATGFVFLRDFWQNYPKAITIEEQAGGSRASIDLFPALTQDQYAWARGTMDEHRLFFWFSNGTYKLRQGMAKTHEIWVGLDGSSPRFDRMLMAVCDPAWYARSGVFGPIALPDPTSAILSAYEKKVEEAFGAYLRNREKNREYGLFNFGDWWGERVINWGNIEYDTQHTFFLQFIRTGDLRYFYAGEEAEIHNRDIDTVLWHRDPGRIGAVYAHSIGHVGSYYRTSPYKGRGSPRGAITVSHTWCEGHLDHYLLTGDRRSLEAARTIADRYNTYGMNGYDFTNTRIPGWHLILTLAMYRTTREPFYLNAAEIIVNRVLERQTLEPIHGRPPGGWVRMMVPGHCHCEPFHYGNAGFMVGILLTGLRWYHQETGDDRVAQAIVRAAQFLAADMWVPEKQGFRYTSCPRSSTGVWSNLPLADGLTYAYSLSGDEHIKAVLQKAIPAGIQGISGFGKSLSQAIRTAPHTLTKLKGILE